MNVFSRRGACPALSAPMQTGDGLLARLNPVTGGLPPKSLIGLCESALRHGNGIIEVTARGSLQIRGLTAESAKLLATEVDALGIAARTGVPVETGPLAGIDPQEIADPRLLAERVRAAIDEAGLTARLGPKASVIVDGGGQLTMDAVAADVRLTAVRSADEVLWNVAVAGDARSAKSLAVVDADAARDITVAALRMVAEKGREAHTRDLSERQLASLSGWHSFAPPSVLQDTSPTRGEIGSLRAGSQRSVLENGETGGDSPISSQVGKMSGRTEGGAVERYRSPIGLLNLNNGHAVGIALPFGSMPAQSLIDLACQATKLGSTEIRLAPGRALLFLGVSASVCPNLQNSATALGFVTSPADPRTRIAACPGMPACASGRIATRTIAETIAKESAGVLDASLTLHISGCAKGCAHPGPAALTLFGDENGAGLVVDGTAKALPAGYRPGYDAAQGIGGILAAVRAQRHQGETAAACLARLGAAGIAELYRRNQ
ncbi:precorrin-3B synthase [Mesorhizobium sp. M1C.F.Ca.ET.193.01.1.1]|uniref:precorrin-3B synthase n=1 Tax=unclassified Mesorhizobium TaxID=325217 RepID=UPI000FD60CC3|nr:MULTISPECIES: precorrin-3B synthase [unclassified Mesorhizobium]TGT02635.1 precorrin-3B synthase [bacterium M00.F.Ca.ET.177.01.1.1]TGQ55494.1 precorrin-3B synthase [Mesorhizobium sp. M1C.F.Ca.ET.210.01.1.1]TGQ73950.1 precorrin-3B synthase [Mesorhizobium sp. M1C.F.Ca.ET.212.01.1.1]TGR12578.1 precorrin-3B synthase [Mesorhizobium sp. M1C.F.Ca.ET.204.01.1.1]TGR32537.1 precorrin-3B synthase [Mesorhizobium sp. M1C.F.Ca.ET.196.01.1.1]